VQNAKKVVVISESTKKDVMKFYGKKESDVVVCYPGFSSQFRVIGEIREIGEVQKKYGISGDYLIAVGTLQPRKNYEMLMRVFAKLKSGGRPETLVIVGKKGWLYDSLFAEVKRLNVEHDVIFIGYVPDQDLAYLLNGAKAYVLASLYEGFGIPILEAQASGVPVACSRVSSIPEVAGEAAVYFNPESEVDMVEKLNQLLTESDLREKLRQKGLENVKRFSWETCAKKVLKTIEFAV
jgi:glycosyltransferase involved in cell wall biosynthesis